MKINLNINEVVWVKLTDKGKEILAKRWGGIIPDWYKDYINEKGEYSFQLHQLFHIYGNLIHMGNMNIYFENNNIIIPFHKNQLEDF